MPNTREKLIELIDEKQDFGAEQDPYLAHDILMIDNDVLADHLIANGVTISNLETVNKEWISVSKRFPQDGDVVLTYYEDGKMRIIKNNGGFPMVLSDELDWVRVTHWMPLPEAPKGE